MNKQKRALLRSASNHLNTAIDIITGVRYDEQDALDNTPENLQSGERYQTMEETVDYLEDAIEAINEAVEDLNRAFT